MQWDKRVVITITGKLKVRIKTETIFLALVVLIALVQRLIFFNGLNWDDDPDYVVKAYEVMTGKALVYPSADNNGLRIGTFYPVALLYRMVGISNITCGLYTLIMSLISIVVIFKLGKLMFSNETGLIASLLLAFYPLDVELSSRLMPDGLLASFSLLSFYFLYKGDSLQEQNNWRNLCAIKEYVLSGILLAWCFLINMSSFVLIPFFALYFIVSTIILSKKLSHKEAVKILLKRCAVFSAAFLSLAFLEGMLYYFGQGDFFLKYRGTLHHYSQGAGFNQDFSMYPKMMLHLDSAWKFHLEDLQNSYYGFYFYFAFMGIMYALIWRKNRNTWIIMLWLLTVWLYLQWGSMSFSHYVPMHRVAQHLSLVTPPMILCIAFLAGEMRPLVLRRILTSVILSFLLVTASVFNYTHHLSLSDNVAPQKILHSYLNLLHPRFIYADGSTVTYQKFLNKFSDVGINYIDIQRYPAFSGEREAYAVLGEHRYWYDDWQVPENWQLCKTLEVKSPMNLEPFKVRIYKLMAQPGKKAE